MQNERSDRDPPPAQSFLDVAAPEVLSDETFVIKNVGLQAQGTMNRALWVALALFGVSAVGLFLWAFLGGPVSVASFLGWSLLGSSVSAIVALALRMIRIPIGKTLTIDDRGAVIQWLNRRPMVLAREAFVGGWYSPQTRQLYLVRRGGNLISAYTENAHVAAKVLERIGVDASKRTMRIRLGAVDFLNVVVWLVGPWISLFLGDAIGSSLHLAGALGFPSAFLLFIVGFFLVRKIFDPAHMVIGADGIIIEQRFGSRFVPFEQLTSISTAKDHVTLRLANGDSVRAKARHLDIAAQGIIEQRVREALALRAKPVTDPAALAALDRGKQSAAAWREALRGLFDKDRGYRHARLTPEQMVDVVADPAAPTDRRIGAALALAQSGDAAYMPKIRIAAQSSANEKARIALEAIAQGDFEHEAIEEAALYAKKTAVSVHDAKEPR